MNPTRAWIDWILLLLLLSCCAPYYGVACAHDATAASDGITTAPPGSRERRAILDALRAELSPFTGPDLVFVVDVLRVRAGWAWIEAAPQSRDGANRYEDVTALLHKEDGRWVVKLLGPCGEAQDQESACDEDTDPERLMERFPTLPPDLVPRVGVPPENAVLEGMRGAMAEGCKPPRLIRSPRDWSDVFAKLDWTPPRVSPAGWSTPSGDLRIQGTVTLERGQIPRDPTCLERDDCRPDVVLAMPSADLQGVRCMRTLELDTETFCDRLELRDTLVRWHAGRWSMPPWTDWTIPMVQFLPACATPCPPGHRRCPTDRICRSTADEEYCLGCLRKAPDVCACLDANGARPERAACRFMVSRDRMLEGRCRQGRCVPDEPEER
ncbi:hypothetical protein [Thiocapsa marina]|uniref:Uncharacterized protein n=1 Tax=Thiocapsa marina 5811 TaxID=768671 RepID=F9UIN2_9GAMM|nr:hypothetical protein [Thiocapsa marina]EGV15952.1 hypothetical protein ThimaDRAFT_4785 [Thiocapsa marina 5811]